MSLLLALILGAGVTVARAAKQKPGDSGGWPEITDEEKKLTSIPQDPEADAVILENDRDGKMIIPSDEWVNHLQYHWRLKVLKPAGKRYAEVRLSAQKYSRISDLEARTIKPDGTVVPVPPDQIFDKTVFQVGSYKITEKVFSFPAVEPGAILEYRYTRNDNGSIVLAPWYFGESVFTRSSRVTQAVPNGSGYMVLCDLCEGTKPEVSKWREGKEKGELYSVTLRDLPAYNDEALMPPRREVSPRLEFVLQSWRNAYFKALGRPDKLFIDWDSVGKYAAYNYEEAIKDGQAALKRVVEGWVQGITDPQDKIAAVLRHVEQDYGYIPWSQVLGFTRPISVILKEKTADNEEKAVLLLAALRTLGVDGFPALVSGKDVGSVNPKFFSLTQFTHAVAVLPGPGGALQYLDPTVGYAPPGFVSWKDSGADVLLLKDGLGELGKFPEKNELNTTKYTVTVKPRPDARADLEIEARFTGEDAVDFREKLGPASESGRADLIKEWLERVRPGAKLVSQSVENLEKLDDPIILHVKAEAGGLVTTAEGILVVHGCVLGCRQSNPISTAARQHPFYVDRGWIRSEAVTIVPPEGMKVASLPPPVTARSAFGSFSMRCASHEENGAVCRRQFNARRSRWDASERDEIRAMYDRIVDADRIAVSFKAGESGS